MKDLYPSDSDDSKLRKQFTELIGHITKLKVVADECDYNYSLATECIEECNELIEECIYCMENEASGEDFNTLIIALG